MMIRHLLFPALLLTACDPAQEISMNTDLEICSATEEKHVEFTNIVAITYTLPPAPKVNCGITYAGTGRLVWNGLHWVHIGGG